MKNYILSKVRNIYSLVLILSIFCMNGFADVGRVYWTNLNSFVGAEAIVAQNTDFNFDVELVLGENEIRVIAVTNGMSGTNSIIITVTQGAPLANVTGNSLSITNGATTPSTSNYTDFGEVEITSSSQSYDFTIQNTGDLALTVSSINVGDTANYTVSGLSVSTTINAGGSTNFNIKFDPGTEGIKNTTVIITNNSTATPYVFDITGKGIKLSPNGWTVWWTNRFTGATAPSILFDGTTGYSPTFSFADIELCVGTNDILVSALTNGLVGTTNIIITVTQGAPLANVTGNSLSITNGATTTSTSNHTDFGEVEITSGSQSYDFTIQNTGDLALTVSSINVGDTGNYTVSGLSLPATIIAGGSKDFSIEFNPTNEGIKNTTVIITNNSTANPYVFDITGEGIKLSPGDWTVWWTNRFTGTAAPSILSGGTTGYSPTFSFVDVELCVGTNDILVSALTNGLVGTTNIIITVTQGAPLANVTGNSLSITNGATTTSTSNHTDFGEVEITSGSQSYDFTIQNTGDLALTVSSINVGDTGNYTVSGLSLPATIIAGGLTNFNIKFDPDTEGTKYTTVAIENNSTSNPYVFGITGEGIKLSPNGWTVWWTNRFTGTAASSILSGGTTDYSSTFSFADVELCVGTNDILVSALTNGLVGTTNIIITVTQGAPLANVTGNSLSITNGATTTSTSNHTDFGEVEITSGSQSYDFTIQNTGDLALTVSSINVGDTGNYTVSGLSLPATIIAGGLTNFNIKFDPDTEGTKYTTVAIENNSTSNPYVFGITGEGIKLSPNGWTVWWTNRFTGTAASSILSGGTTDYSSTFSFADVELCVGTNDILVSALTNGLVGTTNIIITVTQGAPLANVTGNSLSITNGATTPSTSNHTDFGEVEITSGSQSYDFTIQNTGDLALTVSSINVGDTGNYTVSGLSLPATIIAGGSKDFSIEFNPTNEGIKNTTVIITNNSTANPYVFDITGEGIKLSPGDWTVWWTNRFTGTAAPSILSGGTTGYSPTFSFVDVELCVGTNDILVSALTNGLVGTTNIIITVTPKVPLANVIGNHHSITNGATTPSVSNHTDFGEIGIMYGSQSYDFIIQNTGNLTLAVSSISVGDTGNYTVSGLTLPVDIIAGGSTNFNIEFNPTNEGIKNTTVIITNDSTANPYKFSITGKGIKLSPDDWTVWWTNRFTGTAAPSILSGGTAGYSPSFSFFDIVLCEGTNDILVSASTNGWVGTTNIIIEVTSRAPLVNVIGNSLSITNGATTPSISNHTDFGEVGVTADSQSYDFIIQNTGNLALTVFSIDVGNTGNYTVSGLELPITIDAGGSNNFNIEFNPTNEGIKNTTVTITNDSTANLYKFSITGKGIKPLINVIGNSLSITNGATTTSISNHTDFGEVAVTTGSQSYVFTIQNTGDVELTVSSINVGDEDNYTVSGMILPTKISAGGSTNFNVKFDPNMEGIKTTTVIITNNSAANPYEFSITGKGIKPLINVIGNSLSITNGATTTSISNHTDFGEVGVTTGSQSYVFTIQNTGDVELTVSSINVGDEDNYTVFGVILPAKITAGGSNNFNIEFNPTNEGIKNTTVIITNDSTANPYEFSITGKGIKPLANVIGNHHSITNGDITPSPLDYTDFEEVEVTTGSQSNYFTIQNTGILALTVSSINVGDTGNYTVSGLELPIDIIAGGSTNFNIEFNPTNEGIKTTTVIITNNSTANPYKFSITGKGIKPLINVIGNHHSITNGAITPSISNYTDFGEVGVTTGSQSNYFTIQNTGTLALTVSSINVGDTGNYTVSGLTFPVTINAGGSNNFNIEFNPTNEGIKNTTVIITNDSTANPYEFSITGKGIKPLANVIGNHHSITNGDITPSPLDYTDFEEVGVTTGSQSNYFTIQNTGTLALTVSSINVGDTGNYTVSGLEFPVTINAGGSNKV